MLEYIILGTLWDRPLSGYDIRKCIESGIGMFYKASFGSVYPLLGKLLQNGYVECTEECVGKRIKKQYTLTKTGKKTFLQWLSSEARDSSMESFMAKVYFYDHLPMEVVKTHIEKYEKELIDYKEKLLLKKQELDGLKNVDDYYYKISTLYFGICKLQGIINWCKCVKKQEELERLILE